MHTKATKEAKRDRALGNPTEEQKAEVQKVVAATAEKQSTRLTKRQYTFVENYLTPTSPTFANAYQSAVAAGYSKSYAHIITADALAVEWIAEAKKQLSSYEPEHIYRAFQDIASSGSQDRDRLKALELMGKARGMFIDRVQNDVKVTFINDVPRPESEREVIDADPN
jgi:hypothetical protein